MLTRRVGVAAVMKQEAPYLLEWVAWHRELGFEILVADNGGTDGQSQILSRLHALGHITRLDFSTIGEKPQMPAYNALLRLAQDAGNDYLGFIDADEFFEPMSYEAWAGSSARLVSEALARAGAAAISFNWMCFGDGGRSEAGPEPVIERFTLAAEKNWDVNRQYKSFFDVAKVSELLDGTRGTRIHPHGPLLDRSHYSHDGATPRPSEAFGRSAEVSWNLARIRHYVIKTYSEYVAGKVARGPSERLRSRTPYDRNYFDGYNRNEVSAPLPASVVAATRAGMARLAADLEAFDVRPVAVGHAPGVRMSPLRLAWTAREFAGDGRWRQLDKSMRFLVRASTGAIKAGA